MFRAVPFSDAETAHSFPAVHEASQLAGLGKPDDRMNVVRHDDEANALRRHVCQLVIEYSEYDAFRMVSNPATDGDDST